MASTPKPNPAVEFVEVFKAELAAISFRRRKLVASQGGNSSAVFISRRKDAEIVPSSVGGDTIKVTKDSRLSGLALSGGGMRSASFSLGVLQALDSLAPEGKPQVMNALDYLSTVSGGGYIGTSLVAGLSDRKHHDFPFASRLDSEETPEVQHLRDYSNFLAPNGTRDLIVAVAIVVRGLLVNAVTVLPFLLFLALLTIISNPNRMSLGVPDILGFSIANIPHISVAGFEPFTLTINLSVAAILFMFGSAILVSRVNGPGLVLRERIGKWMARALVGIVVVAVFEAQPFVLAAMLSAPDSGAPDTTGLLDGDGSAASALIAGLLDFFGTVAPHLWTVLAPVAVALITIGQKLATIAKANAGEGGLAPTITKYSSLVFLWLAGVIVPILLWTVYIYLSYWAVWDGLQLGGCQTHAPMWLQRLAGCGSLQTLDPKNWGTGPFGSIGYAYLLTLFITAVFGVMVGPNANSLHYLYRDRLSRAFLLDRKALHSKDDKRQADWDVDAEKFSSLKPLKEQHTQPHYTVDSFKDGAEHSPYLLVNAAINIEGSVKLNRRGRNADTFVFSPLFIGNHFTKYIPTKRLEALEPEFGLASAMAISGAAASANMGRATIRPLTFSLALLNIRLGFWFPNPARFVDLVKPLSQRFARAGIWQLFLEAFGKLDERALNVYLTDGGHVENLGVYELVRRRCSVIIAVDSDLDPSLTFPSLVGLEMMARIDLGARIELPWLDLQAAGTAVTDAALHGTDREGYPDGCGPHAAIGIIRYDNEETGVLIHIKSMLTGDENDYVLDYKRRNPTFPHETTLDQFFSEEQFEVYRALGFHAARQLFTGAEGFGRKLRNAPEHWDKRVREALRLLNIPNNYADKIVARLNASAAAGNKDSLADTGAAEAKPAAAEKSPADRQKHNETAESEGAGVL